MRALLAIAGLVGAAGVTLLLLPKRGETAAVSYPVDPSEPYGKVHRTSRPPGLPASARLTSVQEAAYPHIERHALRVSGGDAQFARTLLALADKEGSGEYGRPANNFCATCTPYPECRDRGVPCKITAYGPFQWNQGAWDRLSEHRSYAPSWRPRATPRRPWEATARQEVEWPVEYYWAVWSNARRLGADRRNAARAVFMFHSGPARLQSFLDAARDQGWRDAWAYLGEDLSERSRAWYRDKKADVDERLAAAGVH